jgi:hypothetical protein
MRKNFFLLTSIAIFGIATTTLAQAPFYVPTNGLVGWWPFNGNANDESGNGNNGTVNGAILTTDRFANANKAYSFDGINDFISVNHNQSLNLPGNNNSFSFSAWINPNQTNQQELNILSKGAGNGVNSNDVYIFSVYNQNKIGLELANFPNAFWTFSNNSISFNQWNHVVVVYDNSLNSAKFYINGLFAGQQPYSFNPSSNGDVQSLFFGKQGWNCNCNFMNGLIDDIGAWNRALTPQEISDLYNGNICYETITVTDTLVINMGITGFNPITYNNTIKIFPNPTNDHITIDYGNLASLNGYQLKIINSLGQQVFQSNISQQTDYLNLTTLGGNGLYFVQIINQQGNIIDIKKIVLQ